MTKPGDAPFGRARVSQKRSYHFVHDLEAAMRLKDNELVSRFRRDDGSRPTAKEMRRALMLAYNSGFEVLPSCDNHDERGFCKRHDDDG